MPSSSSSRPRRQKPSWCPADAGEGEAPEDPFDDPFDDDPFDDDPFDDGPFDDDPLDPWDPLPEASEAKYAFHEASTLAGSRSYCSRISSTSHSLAPKSVSEGSVELVEGPEDCGTAGFASSGKVLVVAD